MDKVKIYDATLREGAQSAGVSFTVQDKMRIVKTLDEAGVSYIEAGNPGSNPKDAEFYSLMSGKSLKNARLAAFGATCRIGQEPEDDVNIQALLSADTEAVCVFGKAWDLHVTGVLKATIKQNLDIIRDTIVYLKDQGREAVFDAEHFFDGYKQNPSYALEVIKTACEAGADWVCLCDTNGGCFPHEVREIVARVRKATGAPLGIHAHNDTGMADANAIEAVLQGATMVQTTVSGWGERCGNTNLFTIVPSLQLKLGYECVLPEAVPRWAGICRSLTETVNSLVPSGTPFVGRNAFSHKAGMHIDGVCKNPDAFEHVSPEKVGAERRFLLSEVSGRSAVLSRVRGIDPALTKDSPEVGELVGELKKLEHEGYQFEGAEASFDLMIMRRLGKYDPFFRLVGFSVTINEPSADEEIASAVIRVSVDGVEEVAGAVGNGPVNAMDAATRKALGRFYPCINEVTLTDYKVRVLDSGSATAAKVRVIIESSDGNDTWATVGVSADIVGASLSALIDALEYKLIKSGAAHGVTA